ncbi:MAG: MFS transporter [Catenulispora sp.]|nr:MFS transporter [Catenulispora sp.]
MLDRSVSTVERSRGLGAVILAQLLLRIGSAAGALAVGSYFVDLARRGVGVGSLLLGALSGLTYLTELVFAPVAGAASDRRGRRGLLALAPLLAAIGILITPGASLYAAAPPLILVAATVATARLVEGAGAAIAVPATLGILADSTDGDRIRRGRLTSLYELSSSGGIALGAVAGPLLYRFAGLWAFTLLAFLYAAAGLLIFVFVREPTPATRPIARGVRDRVKVFGDGQLLAFLPAWIAVNAILGTWVTAQIAFVLAGRRTIPGQRFVGALAGKETWMSAVLGGYVLIFSLCIVAWSFLAGRLPTLPAMLVTVAGSAIASTGLILANHGLAPAAAAPIVLVGVFLEAGFTPTALTHLADISARFAGDRGLIMGVYSVVLGLGYLLGTVLGGVFAQWLAFDGLALLTILLAAIGMAAVTMMITTARRPRNRG